jgi:hypothetical protein
MFFRILNFADLVQSSLLDGSSERLQTLTRVAEYCGKPLLPQNSTLNATNADAPFTWDFYNSFFVAVTIVSTIGKNLVDRER